MAEEDFVVGDFGDEQVVKSFAWAKTYAVGDFGDEYEGGYDINRRPSLSQNASPSSAQVYEQACYEHSAEQVKRGFFYSGDPGDEHFQLG
jgi:hypothetical protein